MALTQFINTKEFIKLLLLSLPGAIVAAITLQSFWLLATLYSAVVIIPHAQHQNNVIAIIKLIVLFLVTILLSHWAQNHVTYFIIFLLVLSIPLGIMERYNDSFRTIGAWLFIGLIYTSFEITPFTGTLTASKVISLFIVSLAGVIIALIAHRILFKHEKHYHPEIHFCRQDIPSYFIYFLPLLITLLIWVNFPINEAQWLIWSSLSVAYFSFRQSVNKIKQRTTGLVVGLAIGLIYIHFYPHSNIYITSIAFIFVIISLKGFEHYTLAFAIRCFAVIAIAGPSFIGPGSARFIDVIIGGVVGVISSAILSSAQKYSLRHSNKKN